MWTRLRNYFLTGLIIAAPVLVTIWVTWSIIDWIDGWIRPLIPAQYSPETYLRFTIPGFGVLVAFLFITLVGFLAANLVGRTLLGQGEKIVNRVPLIRALYKAVKQIIETVLADRASNFQKVGLIEHPRKGVYAICLVSTEAKGEIALRIAPDGERVFTVLVPPSPIPTAGQLLFVRESDLTILDMTVEEAIKTIVSVGLVTPEYPRTEGEPKPLTKAEERRERRKAETEPKLLPGPQEPDSGIPPE